MHLPQVQFWSSLRFPWQLLPPLSGRGLSLTKSPKQRFPSTTHLPPVQVWSSLWFPSQSYPPFSELGLSHHTQAHFHEIMSTLRVNKDQLDAITIRY